MEKITFADQIYYLIWHSTNCLPNENITQVTGYIFNESDELLIVKVGENWTIPGGTPNIGETPLETLKREVIEEANVTLQATKIMGYVEVIPENKQDNSHYQARYVCSVDQVKPFTNKFESSARKFIKLENISDYIKWHDSQTFRSQLKEAIKIKNHKPI